jgi:hypothetical protein
LQDAKSNIPEQGNGRDIFERYVRPSIVTMNQVACLWSVLSLYNDFDEEEDIYSYTVHKNSYKKVEKGSSTFVIGNIEIQSKVTLRTSNLVFALMKYPGGDFHCSIKDYEDETEFRRIKSELVKTFLLDTPTGIIRALDEYFGKEYFTLKDIFIEERRKILQILLKGKLEKFSEAYKTMYNEGKGSVYHLQTLGLQIPYEFKISAKYALSRRFNDIISGALDAEEIHQAAELNAEAHRMGIKFDKKDANAVFSKKILHALNRLASNFEQKQAKVILEMFDNIEYLEIEVDIAEAQNTYFNEVYHKIGDLLETTSAKDIKFIKLLLDVGEKLNINTEFYRQKLDQLVVRG